MLDISPPALQASTMYVVLLIVDKEAWYRAANRLTNIHNLEEIRKI